ncbi:MAG: glycosyltransferase family 2 protein [Cyanobacteria bacterium J06628_6]
MDVVQGLLLAAAWVVGLPIAILFIEVMAALLPESVTNQSGSNQPRQDLSDVRRAILIPAHNEATILERTLTQLKPQLRSTDRLVVVADNCSDQTAQLAAQSGATVLERQDTIRRGKGYALDFGLRHLAHDPPDIVVMIDADCQVQTGAIDTLCDRTLTTQRPTQAIYLFTPTAAAPTSKQWVSLFAFRVKNWVRPLGLHRLGQPCLLTGTGMAFPWRALQSVHLASGNLVEDMQLGIDLTLAGYPPLLCPDALVLGEQPSNTATEATQRTRWEHGHLQTLTQSALPLLGRGLRVRRLAVVSLALDLAVPPLALLTLLWGAVTLLATASGLLLGYWLPAFVGYAAGVLFVLAIGGAWARFGQDIPLAKLLSVPMYLLWKVPVYLKFVIAPQIQWIRTDRGNQS